MPHHLLAADLIEEIATEIDCDAWREVILVGPDHFRQVRGGQIGLTDNDGAAWWQGLDLNDTESESLRVYPVGVNNEHGITAVRDILQVRCPRLPVRALVLNQSEASRTVWRRVAGKLAPTQGTLLMISSDFSHHADVATTRARDERSVAGLRAGDFNQVSNDCPACWDFLLGFLGEQPEFALKQNRNSYDYTGVQTNVTSYVSGWFRERAQK